MKPATPEAFRLMMEGSAALTDVEQRGMRVDVPYLHRMVEQSSNKIRSLESDLMKDEVYSTWRKTFGERANLTSHHQLGTVLFEVMKVPYDKDNVTKLSKKPKTDMEALEKVELPFVRKWVNVQKLKKLRATNLIGLLREVDENGLIHPFFNLHLVKTYRSSSDSPNFQNIPKRDQRLAKIIRKAFICRDDDYVMVEIDYGALEFRGAASFWQDPNMVDYASNPNLDIHRDMAAECFLLETPNVSKLARTFAKNQFVFPILYGSYYKQCARHLWDTIGRANLETAEGIGLYRHLEDQGIFNFEVFEGNIKSVEESFNRWFSHWSEQKEIWWNDYLKNGWFPLSTGFVCSGIYSRNDLMNYPIQGPSFHCLLWSLIQINKWLKEKKMRSMIVGQIHDSLRMDIHVNELDEVLAKSTAIMTEGIRQHWPWILTPLTVETEISFTNWFEMVERVA